MMRHSEEHAALAAYAFWSKLEQTGTTKSDLKKYYKSLFNHPDDINSCPACIVAYKHSGEKIGLGCNYCPCTWSIDNGESETCYCEREGSEFSVWNNFWNFYEGTDVIPYEDFLELVYEFKILAGDVANVMRRWCEDIGVIARKGV